MKTLTLEIPDSVDEIDVKMHLAAHLFEKGIMSSGQAADLVGISKREFLENVGKYGVSIFGESIDDIEQIINRKNSRQGRSQFNCTCTGNKKFNTDY